MENRENKVFTKPFISAHSVLKGLNDLPSRSDFYLCENYLVRLYKNKIYSVLLSSTKTVSLFL